MSHNSQWSITQCSPQKYPPINHSDFRSYKSQRHTINKNESMGIVAANKEAKVSLDLSKKCEVLLIFLYVSGFIDITHYTLVRTPQIVIGSAIPFT